MMGLALNPWNLYDNQKEKHVEKWLKNQNSIVPITLWFNRCDNKNLFKLCGGKRKY
jgi:tmRNA-binding protein